VINSVRAFATIIVAALLSSCGWFGTTERDIARARCPQGLILAEASEMTLFRDGTGRDITDVRGQFRIADIVVDCKTERRRAVVDLQVAIAAERGPAMRGRDHEIEYFVAIVGPDRQVLKRDVFRARFEFPENRDRVGRVEELEPIIPIPSPERAPEYAIWVGLVLTPEQAEWNRRPRGAR
jgi:hypothetical protein